MPCRIHVGCHLSSELPIVFTLVNTRQVCGKKIKLKPCQLKCGGEAMGFNKTRSALCEQEFIQPPGWMTVEMDERRFGLVVGL